jgi:hypothetical protein
MVAKTTHHTDIEKMARAAFGAILGRPHPDRRGMSLARLAR